jgi:hypothetical protein
MLPDDTHGDLFYPRLLQLAEVFQSKVLLVEVADMTQAERVIDLVIQTGKWDGAELWRDNPGARVDSERTSKGIPVRGRGEARSLLCWRGLGESWLRTAV